MNMRRIVLLILLITCFVSLNTMGQNTATVKSFTLTTDHIPSADRRNDLNGVPCALVKVQVVDDIERVEGNNIGEVIHKGVEKWIYMCKGSRNIRLHLKNHLPVKVLFQDYEINGLESNRVYELVITVPQESGSNYVGNVKQGEFRMFINPPSATVTVWNNDMRPKVYRPQDNGSLTIMLPYGRYFYKVGANGYEEQEGNVFISDVISEATLTLNHTQQWYEEQRRLEEQRLAELRRQEEQRLAEEKRLEEERYMEEQRKKAIADSIAQAKADSIAHEQELQRQEQARIKAEQEAELARIKKERHASKMEKLDKLEKKPFALGIKAGYNMATAQFGSDYKGTTGSIGGFHVGLTADVRLADAFHFCSGLILSNKGYTYENKSNGIDEEGKGMFIDIPLLASLRLPLGSSVRLSLDAGPYAAICAGGSVADQYSTKIYDESFSSAYTSLDYGFQAGVGLIFSYHFNLGVSYQIGMSNYHNKNLMIGIGYTF